MCEKNYKNSNQTQTQELTLKALVHRQPLLRVRFIVIFFFCNFRLANMRLFKGRRHSDQGVYRCPTDDTNSLVLPSNLPIPELSKMPPRVCTSGYQTVTAVPALVLEDKETKGGNIVNLFKLVLITGLII